MARTTIVKIVPKIVGSAEIRERAEELRISHDLLIRSQGKSQPDRSLPFLNLLLLYQKRKKSVYHSGYRQLKESRLIRMMLNTLNILLPRLLL